MVSLICALETLLVGIVTALEDSIKLILYIANYRKLSIKIVAINSIQYYKNMSEWNLVAKNPY